MNLTDRQITTLLRLRDDPSAPLKRAQEDLERLGRIVRREQSSWERLWRAAEDGARRLGRTLEMLGRRPAARGRRRAQESWSGILGGDIGDYRLYVKKLEAASRALTSLRLDAAFTAEERIAARRIQLEQSLQRRLQAIQALGDQDKIRRAEALAERVRRVFEFSHDRSFSGGVNQWLAETQDRLTDWARFGRQMARNTAQTMGRTFERLFFDLVEGRLRRLSDYFKAFAATILRALTRILAHRIAASLLAGSAGLFGTAATLGLGGTIGGLARGGIVPGRFLPIRALAGGGVAGRPTLGLIGEGGRPEAVVPLPDGRRIPVDVRGTIAVSSRVNVTVNNYAGVDVEVSPRRIGPNLEEVILNITTKMAGTNPAYRAAHRISG